MEQVMITLNLSALYPEMLLSVFACALLLLQTLRMPGLKQLYGYITLGGLLIAASIICSQPGPFSVGSVQYAFNGMWIVDNFSRFFKLTFIVGSILTILISMKYLDDEDIQYGEYYSLILFCTLGMMIMASAVELITIFLGLELMSISLYVLAGYTRTRMVSNESAFKYFVLGSFATAFLLYGIALIYGSTASTEIRTISKYIMAAGLQSPVIIIGMGLLVVGFGFKTAAVPFHMWTPDVYEGAPAPITAFMSAGPKAAAFAAFLRIFMEALPTLQTQWAGPIWVMAVLTMSMGNIIALVQDNIKRMLAYSSIAHAGYALVAFLAAGELGVTSILFYMLAYTFMNIGAFAIITVLGGKGEKRIFIDDYRGLARKHPYAALAMSLFLFSLAGIPPTAGFMGKFYIFSAAVKEGYIWLAIIGVLNSVVSVYYYLKVTVAMYMQDPSTSDESTSSPMVFSPTLLAAILISAYGVLSLGIFPAKYVELVKQSFLVMR